MPTTDFVFNPSKRCHPAPGTAFHAKPPLRTNFRAQNLELQIKALEARKRPAAQCLGSKLIRTFANPGYMAVRDRCADQG